MENFIVSARKYRPATFDTVVGQTAITSTLKNAIKNKHLAQAFLFCGPRGVGKTTCARILAKTINCQNKTENIEACDQCESCKSFNTGNSLNIFELDAASNNSVDDIRALADQVRFAPQLGTHKVYIIDEVHMLSNQAFNAFLKTLEEPPAHAIFILATTEKHKIIPTILSRCQIFDFSRIQIDDIVKHLAEIAQKENISAEADGLHIIAQKADGALRDSLSMFDQIVTFTGNSITYKAVIENLNILDYDYYFKVTDFVLKVDVSATLILFNDVLNNGFDGHNFLNGMSSHLRNLLVCRDEVTIKLFEAGQNIKEKYKEQAKLSNPQFLLEGLNILNRYDQQYKASKNQRLTVELALMNLCSLASTGMGEKKNDLILHLPFANSPKAEAVSPKKAEGTQASASVQQQLASQASGPAESVSNIAKEPKPQVIRLSTITKTVSIKSQLAALNKPKEEFKSDEQQDASGKSNSFSYDEFIQAWNEYTEKVKNDGKFNLYISLSSRKPELRPGNEVVLAIDNSIQKEDFRIEQTELLYFLKNKLQNNQLSFRAEVIELERERKLYTSQDKFSRMAEINPQIVT
ncbi:MAG: DNA polymerase III subunit gamma/tau, partial [Bacteroidetes bacterium]|nr:DNA polymerase III subunit gamma/tau [Bacteroidota bacterium]